MRVLLLPTLVFALTAAATPALANRITDPGFELASTLLESFPAQANVWGGDQTERVFAENGIAPLAGIRMLRFVATGPSGPSQGSSSEFYQLIDVSSVAPTGNATVVAAYSANRVTGTDVDTRFFLRLYVFEGEFATFGTQMGDEEYLSFDQTELISDDDPTSWEELELSVDLPSNADFVALAIVANENVSNDLSDEFDGHYADEVSLVFEQTVATVPATWSRVKAAF